MKRRYGLETTAVYDSIFNGHWAGNHCICYPSNALPTSSLSGAVDIAVTACSGILSAAALAGPFERGSKNPTRGGCHQVACRVDFLILEALIPTNFSITKYLPLSVNMSLDDAGVSSTNDKKFKKSKSKNKLKNKEVDPAESDSATKSVLQSLSFQRRNVNGFRRRDSG
jgi:hypothetical protein